MISRNDICWCGSGKKWKKCCYPKEKPLSFPQSIKEKYRKQYDIIIKTPEQIEKIRKACKLTSEILQKAVAFAKEGITTKEIDTYVAKLTKEAGAIAAPLHYGEPPYPHHICTSLNDVICHGFPDDTPLKKGDILNIDISCILNGYFGDASAMVAIGEISEEKRKVMDVAHMSLLKAISIVKPGVLLNEIGEVIETYATKMGCSVVDEFVGHGIGLKFHEAPAVHHNRNTYTIPLVEGMTFTIEPMINAGERKSKLDANEWTARTIDGKPSAQWEHTILVTGTGYDILTLS